MVTGTTRLNPPRMLDPIITTLHTYYQEPIILPPLYQDQDSNGWPYDHFIPVMRPVDIVNNKCARKQRVIKIRTIHESALNKLKNWMRNLIFSIIEVDKKLKKSTSLNFFSSS